MLEKQQRKDIISYRIEKSHKSFEEAKAISKLGYWNLTGNKKSSLLEFYAEAPQLLLKI